MRDRRGQRCALATSRLAVHSEVLATPDAVVPVEVVRDCAQAGTRSPFPFKPAVGVPHLPLPTTTATNLPPPPTAATTAAAAASGSAAVDGFAGAIDTAGRAAAAYRRRAVWAASSTEGCTPAGPRGAELAGTRAVKRPDTLRRRGPTPRPPDGVRAAVASPPSSSPASVLAVAGSGRTAPPWGGGVQSRWRSAGSSRRRAHLLPPRFARCNAGSGAVDALEAYYRAAAVGGRRRLPTRRRLARFLHQHRYSEKRPWWEAVGRRRIALTSTRAPAWTKTSANAGVDGPAGGGCGTSAVMPRTAAAAAVDGPAAVGRGTCAVAGVTSAAAAAAAAVAATGAAEALDAAAGLSPTTAGGSINADATAA